MNPKLRLQSVCLILFCCLLAVGTHSKAPILADQVQGDGDNLLVNGDFEMGDPNTHGFKWYPPNHFLALHWYRWWVNEWPAQIPEYDDMRPDTNRWPPYSGNHAQVYFKWGRTYEAGIYQVVENVIPCLPHEFSMYVRSAGNLGTQANAHIGLDPEGTAITLDHDHNDLLGWPTYMQWSGEQTSIHTWEQLTVTAETLGNKLTAIAYANPSYEGSETPYYDTWWDKGTLYQLDFPDGKLPEPASWNSAYLQNVNQQQQGTVLNITWNSSVAASTQVWYTINPYTEPLTNTTALTYTVYFPLISKALQIQSTPLDPQPTTYHTVSIPLTDLASRDRITYWVLSRRVGTGTCITEGRGPFEYELP